MHRRTRTRHHRATSIWATSIVLAVASTSSAFAAEPDLFVGRIAPLPLAVVDEMKAATWRRGCPVELSSLRLLTISHYNFDGDVVTGELVMHADVATRAVDAFREVFAAKFPIQRMERIDVFSGSDDDSMAANNTSAFNCRRVTGGKSYSRHAYGVAIDINPLTNPYVRKRGKVTVVEPAAGKEFLKRDPATPGLIVKGDVVHHAFTSRGFRWGGTWRSVKDYQHFEARRPAKQTKKPKKTPP